MQYGKSPMRHLGNSKPRYFGLILLSRYRPPSRWMPRGSGVPRMRRQKRVKHWCCRKRITLPSAPIRGGALITCDNEFILFINNREVDRSDDWTQLHSIPLNGVMVAGDNQIAVIAKNAGNDPNPAGLYFAAHLTFEGASNHNHFRC